MSTQRVNYFPLAKVLVVAMFMVLGFTGFAGAGDSASSKSVFLKIEFMVEDKSRPEFMEIMQGLNSGMRGEKGFVHASVYVDLENTNKITLIEEWQTRALHEEHYDRIVADGSWSSILRMLAENPHMSYSYAIEVQ